MNFDFVLINGDNIGLIDDLVLESKREGYPFLERTKAEWKRGVNCFAKEGEALYVARIRDQTVGMGGINQDPYLSDQTVGRLRRFYVRPDFRRRGGATALVKKLFDKGTKHFKTVRLYTNNSSAATLHEKLGFKKIDDDKVSHVYSF